MKVKVEVHLDSNLDKVWDCWTKPEHIVHWNFAIDTWHCPKAESELKEGGKFSYTMAAKDGSMSFDYSGTFKEIVPKEKIVFILDDARTVEIIMVQTEAGVLLTETFEIENENSAEMQRQGWQSILDNFKKYVEND